MKYGEAEGGGIYRDFTDGGAGQRGIGFELDVHHGWMRNYVSGDRAGLVLKEYYFEADVPLAAGELKINGIWRVPLADDRTFLELTFTSTECESMPWHDKGGLEYGTWAELDDVLQ